MSDGTDLLGKTFGRLTVISVVPKEERKDKKRMYYVCKCSCGNQKVVRRDGLTSGAILSCGCLQKEKALEVNTKHGFHKERLYHVWDGMKQRCSNPNHKEYSKYGGKGISVCSEWANSYPAFREFMLNHGYDPEAPFGECTIDRIDNEGNYCPENCRIITIQEQQHNRETSVFYYLDGKRYTLTQIANNLGIPRGTLQGRLRRGFSIEEAISTPSRTIKVEANGELHTISEWSNILKVTRSLLQARLEKQSMQEIYNEWLSSGKKLEKKGDFSIKLHEVNGEVHNQTEWSKILGIPSTTLRYHLKTKTMQQIYDEVSKKKLI